MRLARIEDLSRTRDVVLFDDDKPVQVESASTALHVIVRGDVALVLLRIARANSVDVFAVRIDASATAMFARRD